MRGHWVYLPMLPGPTDAAAPIRRLREAALADADGVVLEGPIQAIRSFADNGKAGVKHVLRWSQQFSLQLRVFPS